LSKALPLFGLTNESADAPRRRESDYYPTPLELADRIVATVGIAPVATILEPSAGSGSFVRACQRRWPSAAVTAVEPSSRHWGELIELRCTVGQQSLEEYVHYWGRARYDLIIGNPPYSLAEEHVRMCLGMLQPWGRLVFLLRLAFVESQKRVPLWRDHKPTRVIVLPERPSFTANGKTDSAAYAVFEWGAEGAKRTEMEWLI
jgi:hypothetical protein